MITWVLCLYLISLVDSYLNDAVGVDIPESVLQWLDLGVMLSLYSLGCSWLVC